MKKKYSKYIFTALLTVFLVIGGILGLNKKGVVFSKTGEAFGEEISSDSLFPSAKSFAVYLMPYTRFGEYGDERFPDYSAEDVLDFWLSKHDLIITGYSPEDYKAQEPNRTILSGTQNTVAGYYDYISDTFYWDGQFSQLYTWIQNNFEDYDWGFNSVDQAFEDCWLHLDEESEPITFSFGHMDKYDTTHLDIQPYNSSDPTRSRIPGAWDASGWLTNIKSEVYIDFWRDYYTEQMIVRHGENVDGFFLDVLKWDQYNHFKTEEEFKNLKEFSSVEEYLSCLTNLTEMIQNKLHEKYPDKLLAANTWKDLDENFEEPTFTFKDSVDVFYRESSIDSVMNNEAFEKELKASIDASEEGKLVLRNHFLTDESDSLINISRITGLATYYLSMNNNTYFFSHPVVQNASKDPYNCWFDAIAYDIGKPDGDYYVFAEGQDSTGFDYKIFARNFTKAMVLVKPPRYGSNFFSSSRTSHALLGTFKALDADGNLGPKINEISLRNNEGAILLEADTTAPGIINDLTAK